MNRRGKDKEAKQAGDPKSREQSFETQVSDDSTRAEVQFTDQTACMAPSQAVYSLLWKRSQLLSLEPCGV